MSNELIKRIDTRNQAWVSDGMREKLLTDCKAEIERQQSELHKALFSNESLRAINFLQDERIKALEAKPVGEAPVGMKMTQEQLLRTDGKAGQFLWWGEIPFGALIYTAPPSIDALIDELDALPHYSQLGSEDVMKALNKYRVGK